MKTVLMTGLTGSLAPKVAQQFKHHGWNVVEWNHHHISPENPEQSEQFWQQQTIDAVCHMAMGSEDWAAWLAQRCAWKNIPYLFVSTAMVFDAEVNGPYGIFQLRNAQDSYGQYKIRCEDAIWNVNPNAMIARIGWQLYDDDTGNNMVAHLEQQHRKQGTISASVSWYPATSHMDDTAIAFLQLIERNEAGLYHLDSNGSERWSFYEIACAVKQRYNKHWQIIPNNDYHHDQRLQDERIALPLLSCRFSRPNLLNNAGIIGINWGRTHIRYYRENGLNVTALCARGKDALEQVCREENIPHAILNINDLNQLDIVSIATPAHLHADIIKTVYKPHLICEKPLVGLEGDTKKWQQHDQRILVNYAFAQLNTAKEIAQWLSTQSKPCRVTLDTHVNLPMPLNLKQWFLESASHPVSWLLHCFGEFSSSRISESENTLTIILKCSDHQLTFNLTLGGEVGIEYNLEIHSDSTLTSKGYYRIGKKWLFEPLEIDGKTINEGEYTESDCWQDANQRSMALMIAMFNRSITWEHGLSLGAFDTRKAILIEKIFD